MGGMASQITSLTIVYSTVYSGADQRKHQSPSSVALCGEFTGDRWIPRTNGQQRGNCLDDVIVEYDNWSFETDPQGPICPRINSF